MTIFIKLGIDLIDKKIDIRNVSHFADPIQKLVAVDKYCRDYNGFILYNLYDYNSGKCFRCWRMKLYWDLPRATYSTVIV